MSNLLNSLPAERSTSITSGIDAIIANRLQALTINPVVEESTPTMETVNNQWPETVKNNGPMSVAFVPTPAEVKQIAFKALAEAQEKVIKLLVADGYPAEAIVKALVLSIDDVVAISK